MPRAELNELLQYFRQGGCENLRALLRRLACHAGVALEAPAPQPVPAMAGYLPGQGAVDLDRLATQLASGAPIVPIVFYRAQLLAGDTAPIDALCKALTARGLSGAPLFVPSLKDKPAAEFMRAALKRLDPAVAITTTAFAAGADLDAATPLDDAGIPVLQAVIATTKRSAWRESPHGLGGVHDPERLHRRELPRHRPRWHQRRGEQLRRGARRYLQRHGQRQHHLRQHP